MIQMNVSRLCVSRADEVFPALAQIPALQRRRLSPIAKLAFSSAMQALSGTPADYIVWVSQYGDEAKTLKILEDVLKDQTPSPTQFSTSVHNAISGLYSILCQDATPATSLAGSWNDGLIEAYAWLKTAQPAGKALVVYYDEPLPDIYLESQQFTAFAMAALVSLDVANLTVDLTAGASVVPCFQSAQVFHEFWLDDSRQQAEVWQKC
ncbi:MAG: beta-ketoacyl synthase chain length factor [Acinetobacter sp.]|nr:beta-ketoacyl synthase chain length factor [Acinetobacter sp.]